MPFLEMHRESESLFYFETNDLNHESNSISVFEWKTDDELLTRQADVDKISLH
jgi:hypothetical protein